MANMGSSPTVTINEGKTLETIGTENVTKLLIEGDKTALEFTFET